MGNDIIEEMLPALPEIVGREIIIRFLAVALAIFGIKIFC